MKRIEIYRQLLSLYPRRFRERFERDMIAYARERHAGLSNLAFWFHIIRDLARTLPQAHLSERARRRARNSTRRNGRRNPVGSVARDARLATRSEENP